MDNCVTAVWYRIVKSKKDNPNLYVLRADRLLLALLDSLSVLSSLARRLGNVTHSVFSAPLLHSLDNHKSNVFDERSRIIWKVPTPEHIHLNILRIYTYDHLFHNLD